MKPFYDDKKVKLCQGDVLRWALDYKAKIDSGEALPFHATVTDPPYSLGEIPPIEKLLTAWLAGDDFDGFSGGFMQKVWDVMPGPKFWRALLDIHYPGGYLFAFSGTRTADLLGIACRLGGWEPFDRVMHWTYGQGFPKSHNLSVALDKEAGAEREVIGPRVTGDGHIQNRQQGTNRFGTFAIAQDGIDMETAPATPLAQAFDGYGSALKPAGEPVLLFRKPREGRTFAQCASEFGSSGLDIGATRVGTNERVQTSASQGVPFGCEYEKGTGREYQSGGRWPPNTHFTHVPPTGPCPTCDGSGFVESSPLTESFESWYAKTKDHGGSREEWQRLREPGGTSICSECHGRGVVGGCRRVGSKRVRGSHLGTYRRKQDESQDTNQEKGWGFGARKQGYNVNLYADADGREEVSDWECVEGCAVRALDEMAGERKSGGGRVRKSGNSERPSGWKEVNRTEAFREPSTGSASRFYPNHDWSLEIAERLAGETPFRYVAKCSSGERLAGCKENGHPTLKPISLIKWLATLACPPPQFSPRLCVPFSGSGSEVIGAVLSGGWAEVHAIERELEYCEIAAARIAWWTKWAALTAKTDPAEIRKLGEMAESKESWQDDERQRSMFEIIEQGDKS